ncbi:unnamed protein product [Cylindrotheca closterium]|uniref:Uncharacterized protein n=1 Tax=Cylindrotheca closterium TaxID=2856 RepID=A0AAD2FHE6_9STRA|nr:unnamed protein product [Cylindrotheca closterium]
MFWSSSWQQVSPSNERLLPEDKMARLLSSKHLREEVGRAIGAPDALSPQTTWLRTKIREVSMTRTFTRVVAKAHVHISGDLTKQVLLENYILDQNDEFPAFT